MFFDAKILTALLFIALCLINIFAIKTRTSTIAALILAHLTLILFFSLTITNYNSFKEIVLTLIAYLMTVLFLITNYDSIKKINHKSLQIKPSGYIKICASFVFFIIFSCTLYLTNSAFYSMKNIRNNQETLASIDPTPPSSEPSERKKTRLKKKLSENFLLKRSSDVILIIVATTSIILLLRRKKHIAEHESL